MTPRLRWGSSDLIWESSLKDVFASPSGVRSTWLWHNLAPWNSVCVPWSRGRGLRQDQTPPARLFGSQDTFYFYVVIIKGISLIHQQTLVDTYSKWAAAKFYATKTAHHQSHLLTNRDLPFFTSQKIGISASWRTEALDTHDCQLYLGINGHTTYQDQGAASANKQHLRTLPENHFGWVLSNCLPAETV